MAEQEIQDFPSIIKTVVVDAPPSRIWEALTAPAQMRQWMSATEIEIETDWAVGNPFVIMGPWYKKGFENKGLVLAYEHEKTLSYSHLSSLSRLPDVPESYTVLTFQLIPDGAQTTVTLTVSNFPTEAIYRHLAFYWNVAIVLLKKFAEQ